MVKSSTEAILGRQSQKVISKSFPWLLEENQLEFKEMKALRFLWLALFVFLVGIASYLAEELFFPLRPAVSQDSIEWKIHTDLKGLKEENLLPGELQEVHQVFVSDRRQNGLPINWKEISKFHFKQKPTGLYDLQIEIFDTNFDNENRNTKEKNQYIFQFSLFDRKSKNKIWELSRTYTVEHSK